MRNNEVAFEYSFFKSRKLQQRLAEQVITQDNLPKEITRVARVDVSYEGDVSFGAVAVMDYESLEILETQKVSCQAKFPYMPTFFAFREIPTLTTCIKKVQIEPHIFLVNGHGRAHP
jgi:deoxyribonuclease V